jgi:general L-amino acid transport system substrate-binding protein
MKQIHALIVMLMMASVAFTGCVSDDGTIDPVGEETASTLDTVIARGSLKCGVKDSQYGMGYLESDGTYTGLDIEYCKAVAAAIGVDTIEYVLATGSNRFELLASEEIDVLIRTTTWTTSRDADLNADFAGMNFYDGQGILVNKDAFPDATSALHLDGAKICVGIGTTTEGNIADYFAVNEMTYEAVNSDDAATAKLQFEDGSCDAWTGDMSAMVAQKFGLDTTKVPNSAIMPELLSKEPLGAATRDNDADWNDVVTWVWFGMLTAEELGVTSANYAAEATAAAVVCELDAEGNKTDSTCTDGDPGKNRLLNKNLGLGTEANPLSATWMQAVMGAVGNYEEAYTESFCTFDSSGDCLIDRAGTLNAPWWEGGLQYAPPMR